MPGGLSLCYLVSFGVFQSLRAYLSASDSQRSRKNPNTSHFSASLMSSLKLSQRFLKQHNESKPKHDPNQNCGDTKRSHRMCAGSSRSHSHFLALPILTKCPSGSICQLEYLSALGPSKPLFKSVACIYLQYQS